MRLLFKATKMESEINMKIIIYGAGFWGEFAFHHFGAENVYCFCDSKLNENEERMLCGKSVISFAKLKKICKNYAIVISAGVDYNMEIGRQLDAVGIEDHFEFSLLLQMMGSVDSFMEQLESVGGCDRIFKKYYRTLAARTEKQLEYLKEHADITTLKPAKGAMRQEQLKLLVFAKEFFEFIQELEITPFLIFGNLIGAFRHKGFVPWDDDWDFGLTRSELNRLLEFAGKNCEVGTRCGDVWRSTTGRTSAWKDIFQTYPDTYIFDVRFNMIHIYKSTYGSIWKPGIDFWVFDFYKEEYEMAEHRKWLVELDVRLHEIEDDRDKVTFLREERMKNPMISLEMTEHIFPGIDSLGGYPGRKDIDHWIMTKDIFPLKKVPYENTEFWAPNDMETLLRYEYADYMSFPNDVGCPIHIEMNEEE